MNLNSQTGPISGPQYETWNDILERHYRVGRLDSIIPIDLGYINQSYEIHTVDGFGSGRYLLRCYRRGTDVHKIRFEHELIRTLIRSGKCCCPNLITSRNRDTLIRIPDIPDAGSGGIYVAIFEYMEGEDRYAWNRPFCTESELMSAAKLFARYHGAIHGWRHSAGWRAPSIVESIPEIHHRWRGYAGRDSRATVDLYFKAHADSLLDTMDRIEHRLPFSTYRTLPWLAVHGDFHPGNLKYRNGSAVCVFDFDWANMDARSFDMAMALVYFCSEWKGLTDGSLNLQRISMFLNAYQNAALHEGRTGPMSAGELKWLPDLMALANINILDWVVSDYGFECTDSTVADDCIEFLRHGIRLNQFLDMNRNELADLCRSHDGRRITRVENRSKIAPSSHECLA